MSASIDQRGSQGPGNPLQEDAHSEIGDGSSSLSDIEDKDAEQDEMDDMEDIDDVESENASESDANDSEAETERLETTPHNQRKQKDVILGPQAESVTFERSPSKLNNQFGADDDNDLEELSDEDEDSLNDSLKSEGIDRVEQDPTTTTTSLEDSSVEGKRSVEASDNISKKRKRSQLLEHDSIGAHDLVEPARKRTGSVGEPAGDYTIDEVASANGDVETSNPISGDISDAESGEEDEDEIGQNEEDDDIGDDEMVDATEMPENTATGKRKSKKRSNLANGDDAPPIPAADMTDTGVDNAIDEEEQADDIADGDAEDAEAAARNEEEMERKRVAMGQLGDIESHFASFRDRLLEEKRAQLEHEEWMLNQNPPIHPRYLQLLRVIDRHRDTRLEVQRNFHQLKMKTLQKAAVGRRSQIMSQYYQDIRDIREKHLEQLGKQWYDIQHDRRAYGKNVDDYGLRFPEPKDHSKHELTKHEHELAKQQFAYNKEVSLLSGISRYVGFPAAPRLAIATSDEREQDINEMKRLMSRQSKASQGLPLQDFAAMRAATSTSAFKPAEQQFIEQTPWANPQHPSNAHLQRQSSAHQVSRVAGPPRRTSGQYSNGPVAGTFSSLLQSHSSAHLTPGSRTSPAVNAFNGSGQSKTGLPSLNRRRDPGESNEETSRAEMPPSQPTEPSPEKVTDTGKMPIHDGPVGLSGSSLERSDPVPEVKHEQHLPSEGDEALARLLKT